jgi:hypothetical protein
VDPDLAPALRRALWRLEAKAWEERRRPDMALHAGAAARNEALCAGHLLAAARLRAIVAEGHRRAGKLDAARAEARRAARELSVMGFRALAELAAYTVVASLLDSRNLEGARRELERRSLPASGIVEIGQRLKRLEESPPLPVAQARPPQGWGWGLDSASGWREAQSRLARVASLWAGKKGRDANARARALDRDLQAWGFAVARADLAELELAVRLENADDPTRAARLAAAVERNRSVGSPGRDRFLARTGRRFSLGDLPLFRESLAPLLLEPVNPPPAPSPVRLYLLGRPRIETPFKEWPLSLWPEWLSRLWTHVLSVDLLDASTSVAEAERLLRSAADTPPGDLGSLLYEGNQWLRNGQRVAGGIHVRGGELTVEWEGLWCDAREVVYALLEAERLSAGGGEAAEIQGLRERALSLVSGPLLPGMEDEPVAGWRRALNAMLDRAITARLSEEAAVDPDLRNDWLEGLTCVLGRKAPPVVILERMKSPAALPVPP